MSFFEKSLNTLELPAVMEMLAQQAVGEAAKARAFELAPAREPAEVRRRLEETTAAKTMMAVRGSPSFSGVKDVRASLARADLGGALNTRELLDIARVLQCARLVRGYIAEDSVGKSSIDSLFYALRANKFLEEKIATSIVGEDEIADSASPELSTIRRQMRAAAARARDALQKIRPRDRTYLYYHYGFIDDLPHDRKETAEHFHLSDSRAKNTERRALNRVRKLFFEKRKHCRNLKMENRKDNRLLKRPA